MNIAIVDDDARDKDHLEGLLRNYASLHQSELDIEWFENSESFLASYAPFKYTLIFLDIYMIGMNGVETAERIREADPDAIIIFLTTSADHMSSAFSLHVFDYLIKPAEKDRLFRMLDDATRQVTRDGKCFQFLDQKCECRIRYTDIIGVRSNGHYLHITDKDMNEYKSRMTFSEAEKELMTDGRFLVINRGTMVNMDYITDFSNGVCVINDVIYLPYNVKKHKALEQTFRNYVFSKVRRGMH
ncbi:MAG: response regulator transcription factor [Eubacterium sp.]|nr:response regulator transcription factor [Eubacterium sp.]MBR6173631.1 response regulator transcription factor [Eubacterium sp.]